MNKTMVAALAACAGALAVPTHGQVMWDSSFESGNGTGFATVSWPTVRFDLESDTNSTDNQWFYFRVANANGITLTHELHNTGATNVPSHWNTAWPVFSTDGGETWSHVTGPTSHSGGIFSFTHTFTNNDTLIAFHYPYTWTMAQAKIAEWELHPHATKETIGESIQERPIEYFRITDDSIPDSEKLGFWAIARLHSAETTASFTIEGFMDFLLSEDPEAVALRQRAVIHVVPMANPDGVVVGNYRNNVAGVNLNRVWDGSANATDSPEVVAIQAKIDEWVNGGGDYSIFLDFHSTSGANPHFAFHAAPSIQPSLYPTPSTYHDDSRAFLAHVNSFEPAFNPTQGSSTSNSAQLAYHSQRINYGVLAMTPEGAYNRQNFGPDSGEFMTMDLHRSVGEAFARALVAYFDLNEPTSVGEFHQFEY